MRTIVKDHYTGYEGEHEVRFARRDARGDELVFTMWYGHFYEIMQAVAPGLEGWTALALQYHTVTPWLDDPDWAVPDVVAVVEQLDGVERGCLTAEGRAVLDDLVAFIQDGVERGDTLYIQDGRPADESRPTVGGPVLASERGREREHPFARLSDQAALFKSTGQVMSVGPADSPP